MAMEVIRPGPVPSARARCVWPPGVSHPVVAEVLSAQYETTYDPAVVTPAPGVACEAVLPGSAREANRAIGPAALSSVPSYASSVRVALVVAVKSTAWLRPASLAAATLL